MFTLSRKKILIVFLFCIFSIKSGSVLAQSLEIKDRIESKSKELEIVNKQISETQEKISVISNQKNTITKEIKSNELTIKSLELGIKSSEINIEKLGLELDNLSSRLDTTKIIIKEKQKTIASLIRELHTREKAGILETFLSKNTLADTIMEIDGLSRLQGSLNSEVSDLKKLSEDLDQSLKLRSDKKNKLEREAGTLKARKQVVEEEKELRKNILSQTKNTESAYLKQLSILESRQDEISEEIEKLEEDLRAKGGKAPKREEVFTRPVTDNFPITQEYGATKFAKKAYKSHFHNGIDFGLPIGTPISAALSGKVIAAGNNGRYQYGKYVLIEHKNGLVTLYAHLSRHAVVSGQEVRGGDVIAYSGNSGYSTGPHLHFTTYFEPLSCTSNRSQPSCVQLKNFGNAGPVPIGTTVNPLQYME